MHVLNNNSLKLELYQKVWLIIITEPKTNLKFSLLQFSIHTSFIITGIY